MLYTIQTFIEDYCQKRNIVISDNYVVVLANMYLSHRNNLSSNALSKRIRQIHTILFVENQNLNRVAFEKELLELLDSNFKKAIETMVSFPEGLESEKQLFISQKEISISSLLKVFKESVEARAIDAFWVSRIRGELQKQPERIGQSLFGSLLFVVLRGRGAVIREALSGTGFIDFFVVLNESIYLIEAKILSDKFEGPKQLEQYMKTEDQTHGYLLIFDSRPPKSKDAIPAEIDVANGKIYTTVIDINPRAPSSLN